MYRFSSLIGYIKSIGVFATINYLLQRYIFPGPMIILRIPGIKEKIYLRKQSKDVNVFHQIFIKQDLGFLKGKKCKVCIDAGANIGLSTIIMKNYFPDSYVYSIEPETENLKMLLLNTNKYKNVVVIDKALSDNSNGLFFFDTGKGADSFQTMQKPIDTNTRMVKSICITDLMNQYNLTSLDFVKIDIEGAEVFCVDQEALPWIRQSKLLAIEIHEHFAPGCTNQIFDLVKENFKFSKNGEYSIFENNSLT